MKAFKSSDLETLIQITGYQFNTPKFLEGVDNVAIAHGVRNRDKLPVVAKLSHQPLRLEREYHIVQRLYKHLPSRRLLCKPLDRVTLPNNGLIAFIYEDVCDNQLETSQPFQTLEFLNNSKDHGVSKNTIERLSLNAFLEFAIQCCDCLELIHKNQIVHGEIKLNVFLWPKGESVKIWNFGAGSRSLEQSLTSEVWRNTVQRNDANNFLQMLIYMSPEQTGRTAFQLDHRTDLYSLGITFFVVLTHNMPFAHNSPMEILHSVLNKKLPLVHEVRSEVPVAISMIIEKLTNKSPDERYTSAYGLREDLKECLRQLENASGKEPGSAIFNFPLGQYDIASIFTLPNNRCFGRAIELNSITTIIRRTAYMYGFNNRKLRSTLNNVTAAAAAAIYTPLKLTTEEQSAIVYRRRHGRSDSLGSQNTKVQYHHNKKRPTEIIALYGNTGSGKTTLIKNVQQFARDYGYIATAKFDTRQPMPYGCLLRCLSILLKHILAESSSSVEKFRTMLKDQLGPEISSQLPTLLVDNVPELVSFLDQPLLPLSDTNTITSSAGCERDMEGTEIKLKFHSAFIEIFQVIIDFKFVTLFLEDLHQADEASIELLDSLISAKFDFLIILTYRDNEVSDLISKLLSHEESVVSYFKLDNLDQKALMELVQNTMHRFEEIDNVLLKPLVEFIYKRTHGNPFYACQLLMTLEKKNLIYFSWEKTRWEYNLKEIEKALVQDVSINEGGDMNIDFLVCRLRELPRDGRNFLKWASFIGNSFSYETVRNLMIENEDVDNQEDEEDDRSSSDEDSAEEDILIATEDQLGDKASPQSIAYVVNRQKFGIINGLQSAVQQGFIQAVNNDGFKFTHDRYSQAAMMLAPPEQQYVIHLRIAMHFMSKRNIDKIWVADHVKGAVHLIKNEPYKNPYRKVLLQAGDKAFDSGAHKLAFCYYSAARELLTETGNPWKDGPDSKYQETLHLYTRLAEVSWLMDYNLTRTYLDAIMEHAQSAIDRAAAYRVQHRYRWSHVGADESASILLECLRELGISDIQMRLPDDDMNKLYEETRQEILKVGVSNLKRLPVCRNRLIKTRLAILEELCLWAFWTDDIKAMFCMSARFILKTLQHGTTSTAGVGLVYFGISIMMVFKEYRFGEELGEVGVDLCNRYGGNAECARGRYLYASFLHPWKYPYASSIPTLQLAMKQGLLGGDRFYATFAHIHIVSSNLVTGHHMSDVLREAKECLDEADSLGQIVGTSVTANSLIRVILALQGKTQLTENIFDSDNFQESVFVRNTIEVHSDSPIQLSFYYIMKSVVLGFYGFYRESFELSSNYIHLADLMPSAHRTHLMFFFRAVSLIRLIRAKTVGIEYLEEIERSRSTLQGWARHSHPSNFDALLSCIEAELSWLYQDHVRAPQLYDSAIQQAQPWSILTGLMYEYAADYFRDRQMPIVAQSLYGSALKTYRHLGIYGKARQMEERPMMTTHDVSVQTVLAKRDSIEDLPEPYEAFDPSSSTNDMNFSPEATLLTLDVVDLASIFKSSHVISSEMEFDLLMKQMLGIILENSGAESGVIIIKEGTFLVVGRGLQTDGCEIFSSPKPLSDEPDSIMTRLARYAIYAQESLFVVDVQQDSRFADHTTPSKSCICTPIIHKTAVVGCIYIEGAVGSLTSRHEVVLRLLSQQIGISVTNALLFKSIQQVTRANLKMIESQKAALEEARKSKEAVLHAMKLKADFLANMSHELRTPFSGFYGMISLLSETMLDTEQRDIVYTAKESCEMLLKIIDDLLNFSKLEAGKVSLDVGPLVIEEVIADTIEMLSPLAARKGLELTYMVERDVPDSILGDASRLRQILTNLLGNAIKFTHQGGVVIQCRRLQDLPDEHTRLKFEVIDTGIGIRPEQQRQLFEPFSQLDGSTTRKYGGTGLGLSICLQLVRLMMGEIGVESKEGGSCFWFTMVGRARPSSCPAQVQLASLLLATESKLSADMIRSLLPNLTLTFDLPQAVPRALQEHHPVLILDIPAKPSNLIAHQLQSVDDDPECELHIVLLYTPSTEGHRMATEATNTGSDRRGRIVKMAKPVRRTKLMRLIQQVMDHQEPTLPQPSTHLHMRDFFSQDELAWYENKPVLIAEDNLVAQKLLKKQLEKLGFLVESANNGEEAVGLWKGKPKNYYCIGFFDHHMPKCDGVEATKRIRAYEVGTESRFPIVALTADIQSSARDMCVEAGMDGYLTKPLIPKELSTILKQLYPLIQKHYNTP